MITSRELILQHLTTWIQCENDPSKRETAGRIEQQWQAEYRAFLTPRRSMSSPPGWRGTVGSSFFSIQCFYDYKTRKTEERAGVFKCPRDKEVSRDQAQWNMDAAEWINSEQNGKQKSETVCARENAQQEEFQKWVDPTKDSLLGTDQIAFLRAICFPLHSGKRDEDLNTASSVPTNKKRPRRNSAGSDTPKKGEKELWFFSSSSTKPIDSKR